jgi:hypothetical protein
VVPAAAVAAVGAVAAAVAVAAPGQLLTLDRLRRPPP